MARSQSLNRRLFLFSSILMASLAISSFAENTKDRAAWMQEARWGVMTHYLADWKARELNLQMNVEKWNQLIDDFDVEGLARQIESVGAGYYLITLGQNSGYYLSPNATYDKYAGIRPSKCSRRDLVADLYGALRKRGIRLMVYLPSGAPGSDRIAAEALQWQRGGYRNREFQLKWEQVIREWSVRWGMGEPRFSTEQVVRWSRQRTSKGGVLTWDVPIQSSGLIPEPFMDQLATVGKALGGQ